MKKLYSLIVCLFLILGLQAQVEKTIENTAGDLDSLLSSTELATITNLTVTGTMDSRDFVTLRDHMPLLAVLDIRKVSITAYGGFFGTLHKGDKYDSGHSYPADEIPGAAFYEKVSLKTFYFPQSCTSIGSSAFSRCTGLTGELHLPSTIRFIDNGAYSHCTGLTGHLVIPPLVTEIEPNVFWGCSGFTSLTIPPSVKAIKFNAFNGCSGLQVINVQSLIPIPLGLGLHEFDQVNKATCLLRVPYGTKELYASAPVWDEFENIMEQEQGFLLSATSLRFEKEGGTNSSISIKANTDWSVDSDQQWLSASPSSGKSDQILSVTVVANTAIEGRKATLTISSNGIDSQLIRVTQNGIPKTVSITPGGLAKAFTEEEKAVLSQLILTGSMDARDFHTIGYQLPMLEVLDISLATIEAYMDTTYGNHINHAANTIPFAIHEWSDVFQTSYSLSEHPTLSVVKLPASLTTIGYRAFYACSNLTKVEMQSSVTTIGIEAFLECSSLTDINLSPTVTLIDDNAFEKCSSLSSIELPPFLTAINTYTFAECSSLLSIVIPESVTSIGNHAFYRCSKLQSVVMPPNLTRIHDRTFLECNNLTSLIIPKSVTAIDYAAFSGCKKLQSIFAYPDRPVDLSGPGNSDVFYYINKSACILYVPFGSKAYYEQALQWKDFENIVEMDDIELSATELSMEAIPNTQTIKITTQGQWTAHCDKEWLSFSPSSGNSSQTISFTALENRSATARTAMITVSAPGTDAKTIVITQKGITTKVAELAQNRPLVSCYPNPFTEKIAIEILNPEQEKRTVDIYNLAGQRVKNLTTGNRAEKITLSWNGTNEQGKQMTPGIYICKMNGQSIQVVYQGK